MPRTFRLLPAVICVCSALVPATLTATASAAVKKPATLALVLPLAAHTAALQRFAMAVSTPGSELYHQYEPISRLAQRFGASPAAEARTVAYLRAHGASGVRVDHTGLFVDATLKTSTAQALFGTQLREHIARAGAYAAPAAAVHIPAALKGAVTGVVGLDTQPIAEDPALFRSDLTDNQANEMTGTASLYEPLTGTPAGCAAATTPLDPTDLAAGGPGGFAPNQYLTAYNFSALQAQGTLGQGERVALIEIDGYNHSDVAAFAKCFGLRLPKIVGFRASNQVSKRGLPAAGETDLDLEVLDAAAPGLKQIDVYESAAQASSVLRALTAPLQNSSYPEPQVISASLGLCEAQTEEAVGKAGLKNTEAALAEAAASGISFLAASGDDGASDCVSGSSESALPEPFLAVNYPASSPYVTGVGGTNVTLNSANQLATGATSQDVWNDTDEIKGAAGGGGYSTLFKAPSYQAAVAPTKKRVVPDVALLSDIAPGYDVYCTARPACISSENPSPWQPVGGTSAATPLLAGGLALIDEQLRQQKKQSLGLINPLLYAVGENPTYAPQVFDDVSAGNNDVGPYIRASAAPLGCCTAVPGFDAASGWGGVNLGGLDTLAIANAAAIVDVSESLPAHQKPVSEGALYVKVACSGACQMGAYAKVTVGHAKPWTVHSALHHLSKARTQRIKIKFNKAQRRKLRAGLRRHLKITAKVYGAIVDPAGIIERSTPPKSLRITR